MNQKRIQTTALPLQRRCWHNIINKKICKAHEVTRLFCCARFGAPLFDKSVGHLESTEGSTENGSRSDEMIFAYPCLQLRRLKGNFKFIKNTCKGEERFGGFFFFSVIDKECSPL